MEKKDIFDDINTVIRQSGEVSGGLISLSPETRRAFFAASEPPKSASVTPVAPVPAATASPPVPPPHSAPSSASVAATGPNIAGMDWEELIAAVMQCRLCRLCEQRTQSVPGDGNRKAELMFIGEGPGRDEDLQGIPFVGAAGQLLTKMITAMQFDRRDTYIANIVKCRPPGNRNPEPDEAGTCLPYLRRQIELIRPQAIVLLGAVPLKYLLGKTSITRERGHWDQYMGIPVMPTFHPAYLLRYEAAKKDAWSDLQQVMQVFGKVYRKK